MDEDGCRDGLAPLDVSRETLERLTVFDALVRKWSPRINLVSRASLSDLWARHVRDSAQLLMHAPRPARHWLDFGSGAGFPGLVCAILAKEARPALQFTLVESDQRKCAFLRTAARETGVELTIEATRIEALSPLAADIVSARAVAALSSLFRLAHPHLRRESVLLFPKGASYDREIAEARTCWRFTADARPSITDPTARILVCRDLSPL